MNKYIIHDWNVITIDNHRRPMISIITDLSFMKFIHDNNYKVKVQIYETNSYYDNKEIIGYCDALVNCTQNIDTVPSSYNIILDFNWCSYPDKNGIMSINI